ncbi:hypothetical protein GCM10009720_09430 [Yaniella flava]|uniref:Uncharacterized protein n=1 Tax=Yaniella flava TaxID=287930 RepID=A0ABP5FRQ0_9MICC
MTISQWAANPHLAFYCRQLSAVRAQRLVKDLDTVPITISPMFGWADLGDVVGKKSQPEHSSELADGQERYLMPVRLQYLHEQQVLLGDGPHQVQAQAVGPGGFVKNLSWQISPQSVGSPGTQVMAHGKLLVDPPTIISTKTQRHRALETGHEALWDILLDMERQLIAALELAHHNMRSEIYATIGKWSDRWVSSQDIEHLASSTIHNPAQSLMRTLESQIHDQEVFDNVDPQRHMVTKVHQAAQRLIYDAIGDLSDGRGTKIRNAALQLKCKDPDALPQLMLDHGMTDVRHHRSSVVTALNPVPSAAEVMDGAELENIRMSQGGQIWH